MEEYSKYKDSGVKWIGDVPAHWRITSFNRNFTYGKGLPITKADLLPEGIAVISYGQIHSKCNTGTSITDELVCRVSPSYLESNPQSLLRQNDFVFADTSEDIEGSGNCAFNDYREAIFAGYHTVIARPINLAMPKYYAYLFRSSQWRSSIQTLVNGVKVYSISKGILKRSFLLSPPLAEQRAIVSYLDGKVGQIDTYVAKQTQQIELLKELKQAVIANAVTKGIDKKTKLKQTGISWIGSVPQHWERCRCKDVLTETKLLVGNGKHTLLSLTTNGVIVRDLSEGKGKFPKDFNTYKVVKPNDLVFCLFDVDETPRTVGLVHNHGMLTGAYNVFEAINVDTSFLYHYFIALDNRKALKSLYKGLRKVIPLPAFMSMPLYLPPLSEQRAIVSYIEAQTANIDKLIDAYQQQVERIKEYKQRLISDAVTGKMNVTGKQTQTN